MRDAAIFDLDRTLVRGSIGARLTDALRLHGLVGRGLPGQGLIHAATERVGDNPASVLLARQEIWSARGKEPAAFDAAARRAAEAIADDVHPFARVLIEQHRAEGRRLILTSSTGQHLVTPLAEALGFDDVVATRYRIGRDGRFDGGIVGPFVWGQGRLDAIQDRAARHDIDLAESFAYSDSMADLPLLTAVGHPSAVNPDTGLFLYAAARRWPILHIDHAPGIQKVPVFGTEASTIFLKAIHPELFRYVNFDIRGTEHIPKDGPALLVGNHRSYFDSVVVAQIYRAAGRNGRVLAKKEVFNHPIGGPLQRWVGVIEVDRQGSSKASYSLASVALQSGELVCILPQGTIPRGPAFWDTELSGYPGAARLALRYQVPVIPFSIWGSEKVWPRSSKLPHFSNVRHPPTIQVRIGAPVPIDPDVTPQENTTTMMSAITALLPEEAFVPHEPTEAELRETYPRGLLPGETEPAG